MVIRFHLLQLQIHPVVLDQSLDHTGTSLTGSLLFLVEGTLDCVLGGLDSVLGLAHSFIGVGRDSGTDGLSLVLQVLTSGGRGIPIDSFVEVGAGGRRSLVDESLCLVRSISDSVLGSTEVFVGVGRYGRCSLIDVALGLSCGVLGGVFGSVSVFVSVGRDGRTAGC